MYNLPETQTFSTTRVIGRAEVHHVSFQFYLTLFLFPGVMNNFVLA